MQIIPLNKLELSPANVCKTPRPEFEEQLSHDIEAHGLLQNLIVTKAKKRGHFAVIGGGKRMRAMNLIVERGAWQADHGVACKLIEANETDASEVSLAENFQRLAMSPAEECRAFQHFIKEDGDAAAVAKRFGLTQRFVEGRLRLANLAEPIFEALANGDITLDVAKAYASTDQREIQLRVFEQARHAYHMGADGIRRLIAQGSIKGTDPIALLVTEEAYVAAGGRIERDLFSEAGDDRWLDIAVAHELAGAKLEAEAERIASNTGLGWIRPIAATSSWNTRSELQLHTVYLPRAPLSEDAKTRLEAIETRMETINELFDEHGEEFEGEPQEGGYDPAKLNEEYEDLEQEHETLSSPARELPEEWKPEVGRFLILTTKGEMVLDSDYFSEKRLSFDQDEDGNITGGTFEERMSGQGKTQAPVKPEAAAPCGKAVSAKLFDELAVQRRNILAASLIGDPGLALDYAIFALADKTSYQSKGTTIKGGAPNDPVSGEIPSSIAEQMLIEACETLDKGWREGKELTDRFLAFREIGDEAKAAWLAYLVATSIEAKQGYSSEYNPIHGLLGSLLDIDVASMWRPTSENFFDRISKTACLAALKDVGGAELANRYSGSKKAELSKSCHKLFAGEAIVEQYVKERALAWLPPAMTFMPPVATTSDDPANIDGEDQTEGSSDQPEQADADETVIENDEDQLEDETADEAAPA